MRVFEHAHSAHVRPAHRSLSSLAFLVATGLILAACGGSGGGAGGPDGTTTADAGAVAGKADGRAAPRRPTFREDVEFLRSHGDVQILEAEHGGRVALSAAYQARVMTSAVAPGGRSLGWVNREFVARDTVGTAFDNYGGEDRFWLGPEGGQYGLYFPPRSEAEAADPEELYVLERWQVPHALQEGRWSIERRTDSSVTYARRMSVANVEGTRFRVRVDRTVELLGPAALEERWGIAPTGAVDWVGYRTVNRLTNVGDDAWTADSGLLSIWILGQFEPFGTSWAVLPYRRGASGASTDANSDAASGASAAARIVNDAYFGAVPPERLVVRDGYVLFRADGKYRSKIGIGPRHARSVLGSYNRAEGLLTLVHYTRPEATSRYVNSLWRQQERPYAGDVVNAYNDGPPEPGVPALGGFYELETSSPALALRPGEAYTHVHRTVHLTGPAGVLDALAEESLGVSGAEIAEGIRTE